MSNTAQTTAIPTASAAPNDELNPILNQNTVEREYTKISVEGEIPISAPEPVFTPPKMNMQEPEPEPGHDGPETRQSETPEKPSYNPTYTEMSAKDKEYGAEHAADTAIGAYRMVCEDLLARAAKMNIGKLQNKVNDGTINKDLRFEVDNDGSEVNIIEYATHFNQNIDQVFAVDEEFIESVRPPLIRIAKKRGLALTDEQYVGVEVVKDLGKKMILGLSLKASTKNIEKMLIEQTRVMREQSPVIQTPPQPGQQINDAVTKSEERPRPEVIPADENGHAVNKASNEISFEIDGPIVHKYESILDKNEQLRTGNGPGNLPDETLQRMEQIADGKKNQTRPVKRISNAPRAKRTPKSDSNQKK